MEFGISVYEKAYSVFELVRWLQASHSSYLMMLLGDNAHFLT